jgi:hypothetical protein
MENGNKNKSEGTKIQWPAFSPGAGDKEKKRAPL